MSSSTPIKYNNRTKEFDFKVIVYSISDGVVWQILQAQSSVFFDYPAEESVGASYEDNGLTIMSGPFTAAPGSTWTITQEEESSTAILEQSREVFLFVCLVKLQV